MTTPSSPTLDDLFADPLIQAVMRADRVDVDCLRLQFSRTATRLAAPRLDLGGARVRFAVSPRPERIGPRLSPRATACQPLACC